MNSISFPSDARIAGIHQDLRACPDCGLHQRMPDSESGETIRCSRCNAWLRHRRQDPVIASLACTVTCLILYLVALTTPLMTLDLYGRMHTVSILTGPVTLWGDAPGLAGVGILVLLATVLMPGVVIVLSLVLLEGARRETIPRIVPRLLRLRGHLRPWSMVEVYMLGLFVAYTKLIDLAHVEIGPAIYALAAIMVLMIAADGALDTAAIWNRVAIRKPAATAADGGRPTLRGLGATDRLIGCTECGLVHEHGEDGTPDGIACLRCEHVIHHRKQDSTSRTVAFLIAAAILYLPANMLPVLTLTKIGRGSPSTIIAGVEELYTSGMLPLALLVFVASICVPSLKVLGLAWMLVQTRLRPGVALIDRTRLYRIIEFIGRWSMIDVFMISILVAIVHFGFIANVNANAGIVAFAAVVVLTIFAADCFDPRLMWDAADRAGALERKREADSAAVPA